jgi:hypothetical protein
MAGLWEKANKVSEIGYKVHSAAMIVELVAERITDNAESGALWAATEILQEYSERLESLAGDIMLIEKALEAQQIKPKGKKK